MNKTLIHYGMTDDNQRHIAETSIEAYQKIQPHLGHMQQLIYEIIAEHPGCSNTDILCILKENYPKKNGEWHINSVTPRVKELREKERVICIGYKQDTYSRVKIWGAV